MPNDDTGIFSENNPSVAVTYDQQAHARLSNQMGTDIDIADLCTCGHRRGGHMNYTDRCLQKDCSCQQFVEHPTKARAWKKVKPPAEEPDRSIHVVAPQPPVSESPAPRKGRKK